MRKEYATYVDDMNLEITEEQYQAAALKMAERVKENGSFIFGVNSVDEACIAIPLPLYLLLCPPSEATRIVDKFNSLKAPLMKDSK